MVTVPLLTIQVQMWTSLASIQHTILPEYEKELPYNDRVDLVVPLLANGSINLGILYFNEPDSSGHRYGPDSRQMLKVIQRCDSTVGYLIEQLEKYKIYDKINIVITSDHGMAETYLVGKTITVADYIDTKCCLFQSNNPLVFIWPYNGTYDFFFLFCDLPNCH